MKVRAVKQSDENEWSRMRAALWPDTPDNHLQEIKMFYSGNSNNPIQVFVVEKEEKQLIGFIELSLRNYAEGSVAASIPYVEGWYVDKDFQGQGLGKQLIKRAEQWAKENGCNELASDAELDNIQSIEAHKKLGFVEVDRQVCFLKKLS